ncbi:hypothetical protein ACLKA6_000201 [Drosophila palustris]
MELDLDLDSDLDLATHTEKLRSLRASDYTLHVALGSIQGNVIRKSATKINNPKQQLAGLDYTTLHYTLGSGRQPANRNKIPRNETNAEI